MQTWMLAVLITLALGAGAYCQPMLPITRVVLFRSGVGYIERTGTIDGNATLTLMLREPQMNDLLKSMVLIDFDGGRIQTVQYTPRDPLARTLSSYAINIADNPSRAMLLTRLRGVPIEVRVRQSEALTTLQGTILSVESQPVRTGPPVPETSASRGLPGAAPSGFSGWQAPPTREEYWLNLLTEQGVQTVPLADVVNFRLLDERLQRELSNALQTLASGLDNTRKAVELRFEGSGRRRVLVGYITEMPLWKMSYRLVIPQAGKPLLQGWAIVENTTDEDWNRVQVSLVSGRPISFIQNLYEPLYIRRPIFRPPLEEGLEPYLPEAAIPAAPEMDVEAEPMAPGAAESVPHVGRGGAGAMRRGAPPALGESLEEMKRSIESVAQGQALGPLFEYRVQVPVSIERQRSAMLPVINQTVEAEPVSLYNPSRHAVHPFAGVRLINTTELTLMEGAVTIYYGDSYGGDALIDTIEPKGERILTYALDTGVEVRRDQQDSRAEILTLKITRGVLQQQIRQRRTNRYSLVNRDRRARTVLVEQPYDGDWQLIEPSQAERTRTLYRFRVALEAGGSSSLQVVEERTVEERYALLTVNEDTLQVLLRNAQASEAVRHALQEILNRRRQISELQTAITNREERIRAIEKDQERIRANMAQLDRASDLYKQYVQKLTEQEREIEQARQAIENLKQRVQNAQRELADYIQNLNI